MKDYKQTLRNKGTDEWATPQDVYQDLDREFHFDLDPCSSHDNHKCSKYYTKDDDGLSKNWGGYSVFCNPPYSDIKSWIRKCYQEGHKPNTIVVALVPSRTDTRWWQNYVQHRAEVRFIAGRLHFNESSTGAPFPSAIVIYRGPKE